MLNFHFHVIYFSQISQKIHTIQITHCTEKFNHWSSALIGDDVLVYEFSSVL